MPDRRLSVQLTLRTDSSPKNEDGERREHRWSFGRSKSLISAARRLALERTEQAHLPERAPIDANVRHPLNFLPAGMLDNSALGIAETRTSDLVCCSRPRAETAVLFWGRTVRAASLHGANHYRPPIPSGSAPSFNRIEAGAHTGNRSDHR